METTQYTTSPKVRVRSTSDELLYPFEWYRHMQETEPVAFNEEYGCWFAFSYEAVKRALSESATFSVRQTPVTAPPSEIDQVGQTPIDASILFTDPPRHRQLRSLVSQAFTPRRVASLEPRIIEIVDQLLDQVQDKGEMDVVDDLAYPLPVIVIAELMGIPTEDRAKFKQWSDALVIGSEAAGIPGVDPQIEMGEYFLRLMEERRRAPKNDLITSLLAAQIDGQHLTRMELLGFCILLLVAGNETTTNLITNTVLCLHEHPEAMDKLNTNSQLVPGAIEEVLRYRAPVRYMFRTALSDTQLGGKDIRAGEAVLAWMGAANHDPRVFANPERFDIERNPNRHLAFGNGIHFCLGAPLARMEGRIALTHMLERMSDIRVAPDAVLDPIRGAIVHGVRHLPITFSTR